jgi:glycosyltransferase involved in cell wall biosynthesis
VRVESRTFTCGQVAEWLCSGLQSRVRRFDSDPGLHFSMPASVALIVSTCNQPRHLERCLLALTKQRNQAFELLVADDGSKEETRTIIDSYVGFFGSRLKHEWQEDKGFRKTRILNRCIIATEAEYLIFLDGDCVAHPDYVNEHLAGAVPGEYQNGAIIRLNDALSNEITTQRILDGTVFEPTWLRRTGGWNRRYLKLSLPYGVRRWMNGHSTTKLYWLGSNSACWRSDALAVNGFDNRFSYGFEDGDFGNRLSNYGVRASTVRWTANLLHLDHGRPYRDEAEMARNLAMVPPMKPGGIFRAVEGIEELENALDH